jgi:hypothetical protein
MCMAYIKKIISAKMLGHFLNFFRRCERNGYEMNNEDINYPRSDIRTFNNWVT